MPTPSFVEIVSGDFSEEEIHQYIKHIRQKHGGADIRKMTLTAVDENGEHFVDVIYELMPVKFERIRRITGYLVGSLDRFNDAKKSEVSDRVSHTASK